jgi:ribonuclease VapC
MATGIDLAVYTSALTAILLWEPEAADLLNALAVAARIGLCASNRTEFLLVIQSWLGDVGVERAKRLLAMQRIDVVRNGQFEPRASSQICSIAIGPGSSCAARSI